MITALLPLFLALTPAQDSAPEAPQFEVTAELLESVGARAQAAVELALDRDLSEYVQFKLATQEDLEAVLKIEMTSQFLLQFEDEDEAARNRDQFVEAFSGFMIAKYSYGNRTILVLPSVLEGMAELLGKPNLNSEPALYAILVHEVVHAFQDQAYDWEKTLTGIQDATQLQAFNAVVEGQAQFIAKQICSESPWKEGFETFTSTIDAVPESATETEKLFGRVYASMLTMAYLDGAIFIEELLELGGQEAVDRAFRNPPTDIQLIYHADWFMDPSIRPESNYELKAGFAFLEESYPEPDWTHLEIKIERPQLAAGLSMLPKEEVDAALEPMREALVHIVSNPEKINQKLMPALIEFGTPEEAAAFFVIEERVLHLKDELLKEGPIRITESTYRNVSVAGARGVLAEKTLVANGEEVQTQALVLTRAALLVEVNAVNLAMSEEELIELGTKMLRESEAK